MGSEASNVERLTEAYARWSESKGGSVDHWMTLVADDIQFGSLAQGAPRVTFLRSYSNRDALADYFAGVLTDWEMLHYSADEFVAQDDRVVMRGSMAWRNKQTGRVVETPKVDYWRFQGGKAVEFYEYYDTARVLAAAHGGATVAYSELLQDTA
jgi:uncharacterized protein